MSIAEKLNTIAENQRMVYDAGYAKGKAECSGIDYDKFWDNFQNNGQPATYYEAFAYNRFDDETYNPKYPILCGDVCGEYADANCMFWDNTKITDTKVTIDVSEIHYNAVLSYAFYCPSGESHLETIRELKVNEDTDYNSAFKDCRALKNIAFSDDSIIGKNISFSDSPLLTRESIENVCRHLSPNVTTKRSVVFHTDAIAAAFPNVADWDSLQAENSKWTYTLSP